MLKLSKTLLLLLFLCCNSVSFFAQQYSYVQYNTESGAPFDQVSSVVKGQEGYIWIGSQNGLYRFDGNNYDEYTLHTKSQFIHQIHTDSSHLLFVNDIGAYTITNLSTNPTVKPIIEGSINETEDRPFYPNDFIVAQDSTLWVSQSNHSIGRLQNNTFKVYRFSDAKKAQKIAFANGKQGDIWALSPLDGLFKYNPTKDIFEKKITVKNGTTLHIEGNYLFIGSNTLKIYSLKKKIPRLIRTIKLENDQISDIISKSDDQFIIGTKNGKLLNLPSIYKEPETIYGANEAHRVEELDFGSIYEIFLTQDSMCNGHKIWVASENGLWILQEQFFKTVDNLPMSNPIGITMTEGNKVLIPINYLYEAEPYEDGFIAQPILNNLQANAAATDQSGFTWVTTSTPKVKLLKFDNNKLITTYDFHEQGESIFYLFPDSKNNLWYCQAPTNKPIIGLGKINAKGEAQLYNETKGFSSRVLAIKESNRGEIYAVGIGEESYLYKYDSDLDQFINVSPTLPFTSKLNFEAHDLTIDDRGVVWLATTDGLLRFDGENLTRIQNEILNDEEVRGVTHLPNNAIWISTATHGLVYHYNNTSTILGELAGLPAEITAYRCITTDGQGRLWAGTAEGLVYSRIAAQSLPFSNTPKITKIVSTHTFDSKNQVFKVRKGDPLQLKFTNLSFPGKDVQ
ncbi:MAG: hypothetical protein P1U56_05695 [Saprospiraceae bacterium]|nr:hypothetical protein [Saprospiraceae bacterium]